MLNNAHDNAAFVKPARELHKLHASSANWKLVLMVSTALVLIAVSAAMSMLTAGVLIRLDLPEFLAYTVGAMLHIAIAISVHLVIHGAARQNRLEKAWGVAGLVFGLSALVYVFVARATGLIDEGRSPAFSWLVSGLLMLIEVLVPGLFGFLLAKICIAWEEAAGYSSFFKQFRQLIENSEAPARRWSDAVTRQMTELARIQRGVLTAKPEEKQVLFAEAERINRRVDTLKEWHPAVSYPEELTASGVALHGVEPNGRRLAALPAATLGPLEGT